MKNQVGNQEIKEKQEHLIKAREKIEDMMELFKSWEKETKTKAFSNEGLASAKVDKKEEEKSKANSWLNDVLQQLNDKRDEYEAELERFNSSKKGQGRGKMQSAEVLTQKLDDIAIQSQRVELLMRSLENEAIGYDQINDIKDTLEFYMQNQDDMAARKAWDDVVSFKFNRL